MTEDPLEQSTPPSPARQLSTPRGKGSSHAQQQGNFTSTSSSCGKGELIGSLAGYPQISTTGCTTNCRLPRLVARPTADCHDWLHDQLQIATTGCTTNCRLPRLVARPTADCHDWLHDQLQIATTLWGWHGLCLGMHGLYWHVLFARSWMDIYIHLTFSI